MRNLAEYPITKEDIITTIDHSYRYQVGMGYIGDPACYCLSILKEYVQNSKEFEEFLKTKEIKNV